jgi:hypothetical protein
MFYSFCLDLRDRTGSYLYIILLYLIRYQNLCSFWQLTGWHMRAPKLRQMQDLNKDNKPHAIRFKNFLAQTLARQ